jgi:hypothetical protein
MTGVIGSTLSTFVPQSRTLTINGVTYDLSANRSWTVAGGLSGTIATGQVAFASATNTISGTNNLFFDSTNVRFGIRSSSPTGNFEVKTADDLGLVRLYLTDASSAPLQLYRGNNGNVPINTFVNNGTISSPTDVSASGAITRFTGNIYLDGAYRNVARMEYITTSIPAIGNPPTAIRWLTTNASYNLDERAGITANGNFQIGSTISTNKNSRLWVQSSGATAATWTAQFHNSTGTSNSLVIDDSGSVMLGTATSTGQRLQVVGTSSFSGNVSVSGDLTTNGNYVRSGVFEGTRFETATNWGIALTNATNGGVTINNTNLASLAPTGNVNGLSLSYRFGGATSTFTNNTILIGNTINQTSGTGITRGVYINPTLTLAPDWRSIEWSNNTGWGLYGAGTAPNYLGGSLLIGTTTLSGFLVDINGTARVSGSLTMGLGQIIYWGSQLVLSRPGSLGVILSTGGSQLAIVNSANTSNLLTILNSGEATFSSSLQAGGGTTNASAILQADSISKGFLPPRMTNAQRIAIASPAVGLIVYCTDATEGLYQYINNAWVNLTGVVTNRQTASYTLALGDSNDLVEMNVASANNLTVPLDSAVAFPIGTKIDISQYGAGQTTVVATGGVTVRSAAGALKLAAQYSGATLVKIATNEWYLFGDITV